MQWRDATVATMEQCSSEPSRSVAARHEPEARQPPGQASAFPAGLDLPCTRDPELFFAESPDDLEQAKAMCRGCRARMACLSGALERREPWGVWGGELLMRGAIVPRKRPRGRPRKTERKAEVAA